MKTTIMFFGVISFYFLNSCGSGNSDDFEKETVENEGIAIVKNGKDENDTIHYSCVGCKQLLSSRDQLNRLIKEITKRTCSTLNFPLSFNPQKLDLTLIEEKSLISVKSKKPIKNVISVSAECGYIAKNGYGNELEGDDFQYFYLKDLKIADIEDELQLAPLKLIDGTINRSLELTDLREQETLKFFPGSGGALIVVSSLGCVDEGTWLILKLENGEEIKLISWNDFNCDGNSYFRELTNDQKKKLKESKLKEISLIDDKAIICEVPLNQSDYLQQLIKL